MMPKPLMSSDWIKWFYLNILPAFAAFCLFLAIPFIELAAANVIHGVSIRQVALYYVIALGILIAVAAILRGLLWKLPFWRISICLAPIVIFFFSYQSLIGDPGGLHGGAESEGSFGIVRALIL